MAKAGMRELDSHAPSAFADFELDQARSKRETRAAAAPAGRAAAEAVEADDARFMTHQSGRETRQESQAWEFGLWRLERILILPDGWRFSLSLCRDTNYSPNLPAGLTGGRPEELTYNRRPSAFISGSIPVSQTNPRHAEEEGLQVMALRREQESGAAGEGSSNPSLPDVRTADGPR